MNISSIIVVLDYLLRMASKLLDKLMKNFGITTTVAPETTVADTETTTAAETN